MEEKTVEEIIAGAIAEDPKNIKPITIDEAIAILEKDE